MGRSFLLNKKEKGGSEKPFGIEIVHSRFRASVLRQGKVDGFGLSRGAPAEATLSAPIDSMQPTAGPTCLIDPQPKSSPCRVACSQRQHNLATLATSALDLTLALARSRVQAVMQRAQVRSPEQAQICACKPGTDARMHVPASRLPPALSSLATMTHLENVQEVDERNRTEMENLSVRELLLMQSLEATAQDLGLSRTEALARLFFSRAQSQLAVDGPVKQIVPDTVCLEGLLPFTDELEAWRLAGNLTAKIVSKPPKHDKPQKDLESDLYKHIVCAQAAALAFDGKVRTEKDFLEKDLSGVLQPRVWKLVQEARPFWRKTTMIGELSRSGGKMCLLVVYRCDINRASAEDTTLAVSFSSKHRHTQPRAQLSKTARMLRVRAAG